MKEMKLSYFTEDPTFPFYIQYGEHEHYLEEHTHLDFDELVIVLRGHADHIVSSETYPIQKGDVFVISSDTAHGYRNARDFRICNIMFRKDHIFNSSDDLCAMEGYHALFVIEPSLSKNHAFTSRLSLQDQTFVTVNQIINQMIAEYQQKRQGYQTFLKSSFLSLSLIFARIYQESSMSDTEHLTPLITPIAYLEQHYQETITVEQLAKQSGLSVRHFNRLFQNTYRTSPGRYLLQYRIQKSENLLLYTNMPIAEIAYQCGFNDSNYFSRQFRKIHGISPRQYREHTAQVPV
ncbi:MAG: AraC family transcriptional regulator [Lachnospiraceae bacterium]|nr:AraC family transcriptional regulator [Lachnospiraceae bacterium]